MKKLNRWPVLLIGLALILAACGQSETGTDTPGFTDEPMGTEASMPPVDGTDTGEITTPAVTEAVATVAVTEPVTPTASVATTEPVSPTQSTGGEVIPSTGAVDPGRVSNLLDFEVCNTNNEQIGAVDDLIIDLNARQVTYVVVEADENNPLSKDLKLVPWGAFTLVAADVSATGTQTSTVEGPENCFLLDVEEEQFENVPEFNFDNFPGLGEDARDWDADFNAYWQETVGSRGNITSTIATTNQGFQGVARATELLDLELGAGDTMVDADVDDILIDYQTGEVLYFVVSFDPGTGESRLFAVPFDVLGWNAGNRVITVITDPNVIIQAPNFNLDAYPVTTIEGWDDDLRAYWDTHIP